MREGQTCGPGCNCNNCDNTDRLNTTTDEVEAAEKDENLTATEECRSELVEDDDDADHEDDEVQMDDLEEDWEVYDDDYDDCQSVLYLHWSVHQHCLTVCHGGS